MIFLCSLILPDDFIYINFAAIDLMAGNDIRNHFIRNKVDNFRHYSYKNNFRRCAAIILWSMNLT